MARLKQYWINIKTSYWFIPALINISLVFVAMLVIELDHRLAAAKQSVGGKIFSYQQESARTFLGTIAGSMMTIAGVVFSITILVLAQTAGQYSSRVLRNFMRRKSNQIILGVFVGIFIFCLFLITNLHPTDNGLTVLSGFFLAIVGVGFLIYFIHQTSISIQASEIISSVYEETIEGIEKMYPDSYKKKGEEPLKFKKNVSVPSKETGYLQAIDSQALLQLAIDYNTHISLNKKVGEFVAKGEIVSFIGKDLLKDENFTYYFFRSLIIGKNRSAEQDVSFGVQQVVDIALRGLSPGINDLSTAQTAIDYLGSIYIALANRDLGNTLFFHENNPILYIPVSSFGDLIDMGLSAICSNAKGQPTIQNSINKTIQMIKAQTLDPERKAILEGFSCSHPKLGKS